MNSTSPTNSTPRRYLRSRQDKKIAGVCGGLARYFGIDPTLVRIAAVVFTVMGGAGLVAYAALWILVPYEEDEADADVPTAATTPSASPAVAA